MLRVKKIKKVSCQPNKIIIFYEDGSIEEKERTILAEAALEMILQGQGKANILRDVS